MKSERFIKERDDVFDEYQRQTNMTFNQLKKWSDDPCSRKASLSRGPLRRNIRLKSKEKEKWNRGDVRDAKRTLRFLSRHKKQSRGNEISEDCPFSKRTVALRNWGYDPL